MSSLLLSRILVDVETLEPEERGVLRAKLEDLARGDQLASADLDELRRRAHALGDGTAVLHDHEDVRRDFLQALKR